MQMKFNQKFINPLNQIFNFNHKIVNQKELSTLMKLINKYKVNQEGQKLLFVIIFASQFNVNKDNLKELVKVVFKENTSDKVILIENELIELFVDLVDMKLNTNNTYFNPNSSKSSVDVYLEELYVNFNGKIDDNINVIVKSLQNNWDLLSIDDFDKLDNKIKTTLLWQLKFGVSPEILNFMKRQNKHINDYKCKLTSIERFSKDNISSTLEIKLTSLLQENQDLDKNYNELKNKYDELQQDYDRVTLKNKLNNMCDLLNEFEIIEDNC